MIAPVPTPAALPRERTFSLVLMIIATVLYGISLGPWLLLLMFSPMMYDTPDITGTATILLLGILGWPVSIVIGLIVGWWKRRYMAAILGSLTPVAFALVIVLIVAIVNPGFF